MQFLPLLLLIVPTAFAALIAVRVPPTRLESMLSLVALAAFVVMLTLGGAWAALGLHTRWLLWPIAIAASVVRTRRVRERPAFVASARSIAAIVVYAFTTAIVVLPLAKMIAARRVPPGAVSLRFPLRSGGYAIGQGGANASLNGHALVHAQSYALDIIKLNALGARASGLRPAELTGYVIFGDKVYAPCDGEVLAAVDEHEDLVPPGRDPAHRAGNHVVVYCDGISILLAHLRRGSVAVTAGQRVATTDAIGAVGNTGNTSEPHLHIHAVRGRVWEDKAIGTAADPVAMLFNGRFFVRNDRLVVE